MRVVGGASGVLGDRVLLRLALKALVDQAAATAPTASRFRCRSSWKARRVRFSLTEAPPLIGVVGAPMATPEGDASAPGLSFVRRVAELHGGTLTVEEASAGRQFTLVLLPA